MIKYLNIFTNKEKIFVSQRLILYNLRLIFIIYINKMTRIAESELIINRRGAVYHLDLRPEELASTVILVGDPDRVGRVSKHFDKIEFKLHHREFNTHTGEDFTAARHYLFF